MTNIINKCKIYYTTSAASRQTVTVGKRSRDRQLHLGCIWSLAALMGLAMAPVFTTVIGQCMGARDIESANMYFRKLMKISFILSVIWNAFISAVTPGLLHFYALSDQTAHLVIVLVLINNVFNGLTYPYAGPLGSGLRAVGDVKFTMIVSVSLTIAARLLFLILLGIWMNLEPLVLLLE